MERFVPYHRNTGDRHDREFADALEHGFRAGGWRGATVEGIEARLSQRETNCASRFEIACIHADLGDQQKAFEWLNTAYFEHDFLLKELNSAFEVDPLRSDPRFAELVRKVGLSKIH